MPRSSSLLSSSSRLSGEEKSDSFGIEFTLACAERWRLMKFPIRSSRKRRAGAAPVHLNVYDITTINGYAYWFGLGVYHSGVQVHGVEYAYGAHEQPTTGIFEAEPRQCPVFTFRKSILIGRTDLGPSEVRALMEEMAAEYTGSTYNLIAKNCNHFCNEACRRLAGKSIPRWVNRLAKIGILCYCVLPVEVEAVRQPGAEEGKGDGEGERRRRRSNSTESPLPPTTAPPNPSSSSSHRRITLPAADSTCSRSTGSKTSQRS